MFSAKAAVAVGDYIIAQSDQTMGYGHVPVEDRDYRYSDEVKMNSDKSLLKDPNDILTILKK